MAPVLSATNRDCEPPTWSTVTSAGFKPSCPSASRTTKSVLLLKWLMPIFLPRNCSELVMRLPVIKM